MILYDGRPATAEGREPKEMRVYDLLDSLGIAYQRTDHAPATTMEVCSDRYDTHEYVINLKELHSHRFDEYYEEYAQKYSV